MVLERVTEFRTLKVFYILWKSIKLRTITVKRLLKEDFDLELTVLVNKEISTQSPDGKNKYSDRKSVV